MRYNIGKSLFLMADFRWYTPRLSLKLSLIDEYWSIFKTTPWELQGNFEPDYWGWREKTFLKFVCLFLWTKHLQLCPYFPIVLLNSEKAKNREFLVWNFICFWKSKTYTAEKFDFVLSVLTDPENCLERS